MGTRAHVIVTDGTNDDLDFAQQRIEDLESKWSRFRDTSDISRLNRAGGAPVVVSSDTVRLLRRCVQAWHQTSGAFDPTVHDAMVSCGYDRDFSRITNGTGDCTRTPGRAPGLSGVVIDAEHRVVSLPRGVRVDPGAIGKGLAADVVCRELRARGRTGACVNLGGDLRVSGRPPNGERWSVSVEDPLDASRELMRVGLDDAAVATSSRLRRVWQRGEERFHHVIDPRTGRPAGIHTAAVTVIARSGWWAEVTATSCLLADDPVGAGGSASVVALDEHGGVRATPDLEEVLACSAP